MAIRRRHLAFLATHLAAAVVGAAAAVWLTGGGGVARTETSPNGAYMLVLHRPDRIQRLLGGAMETPYVAELHRLHDEVLLCRSRAVDLYGDAERAWAPDSVRIGGSVEFRPFARNPDATCRWAADAEPIVGTNAPPASMTAAYSPVGAAR